MDKKSKVLEIGMWILFLFQSQELKSFYSLYQDENTVVVCNWFLIIQPVGINNLDNQVVLVQFNLVSLE